MKFHSLLLRRSRDSLHHRYRHIALLAKGKQIFAVATNSPGHHAEINALVKAGSCSKGATLYTLMTRASDGSVGNGSPCPCCMEALSQAKVKRVVVYLE